MLLTFEIKKQLIRRTDKEIPVAKSENYLYAQFSFSEEWEGTKTAIFNNGTPYSIQLDNDNKCLVPWEVITESGFSVSVFCGERITANVSYVDVLPSGYIEGQTPAPPSPTVYDQLTEAIEQNAEAIGDLEDSKQNKLTAGDNITIENDVISATGGSSVQVDEVTLTDDNGTLKVKTGGIDTTQIKDSAVTSDKLATDSVTFTKIKNGQITEEKLQTACVTTGKIADASVTSGKLAQKSVTWQKLADSITGVISSKQNVLTAGAGISISNNVISATAGINIEVVQALPSTGDTQTIYLVPNSGSAPNIYDEYIYVNNAWEKIGTTDVDLSNYYTKTETNTLLNAKADTSALASKLDTNQGSANVGKVMTVGADGSLTPQTAQGTTYTAGQNITIANNVISAGIEVIEI